MLLVVFTARSGPGLLTQGRISHLDTSWGHYLRHSFQIEAEFLAQCNFGGQMPGSLAFPLCELVQSISLWDSLSGTEQTLSSARTWTHLLSSCCGVRLFETLWMAAHQASLSYIISQSLLKLMSAESVMPSSHLILCCPLLQLGPMDELSKQPLLFCYGCSWCENDLLCTTVPLQSLVFTHTHTHTYTHTRVPRTLLSYSLVVNVVYLPNI